MRLRSPQSQHNSIHNSLDASMLSMNNEQKKTVQHRENNSIRNRENSREQQTEARALNFLSRQGKQQKAADRLERSIFLHLDRSGELEKHPFPLQDASRIRENSLYVVKCNAGDVALILPECGLSNIFECHHVVGKI